MPSGRFFQNYILVISTPQAMTHSSADILDRILILERTDCFNTQKSYPTSSLNEFLFEFQFESDRNMIIDSQKIFLFSKVKLGEENVLLEAADDAMSVTSTMHSLFWNCDVYFNTEEVYTSNGLYAPKTFISDEFVKRKGNKISICACQVYRYEKGLSSFVAVELFFYEKTKNKEICFYG